jgi:hypothetical protein
VNDTIQQTAADTATEAAINAVVTNAPPEKAEQLFNRASVEHRRSAPREDGTPTDQSWRDGHEALAAMPAATHIATSEADVAIGKLNSRGEEHSALVNEWGSDFGANLAYAKSAFKEVADKNPGLIAQFEKSGLGDSPAVLQFLARHGRLTAGLMNDHTIARNNEPMSINRTGPTAQGPIGNNRGSEETRSELARMMREAPPGSALYKDPHIQARIQQLHRTIAGSGSPVGIGGRRA